MAQISSSRVGFSVTLSVAEAARLLDVVPATIYQWVRNDELPNLRLGGRVRIPTAKLADLLGVSSEEIGHQIEGLMPVEH